MTELVVRRLLIDLNTPVDRHWCGGDAFRSAFFGALSMSFPIGEQFFIDSVRAAHKALPPEQRAQFTAEVQGFVGQEATHRRIHSLFNAQIEKHGLVNAWEPRARPRMVKVLSMNPLHGVAITAANEHFTALFADWMLTHPEWLDGSEPRLRTLWLWHAAEEFEHRTTAFDLYRALGGNSTFRRNPVARVHLAKRSLFPVWSQGSGALHFPAVAGLVPRRFPPQPAFRRTIRALAARKRRQLHTGRTRCLTPAPATAKPPGGSGSRMSFKATDGRPGRHR